MKYITGNKLGGSSFAPYLQIGYEVLETDEVNNRSRVRAYLYFKKDSGGSISYAVIGSGSLTINGNRKSLQGPGTYISGTGSRTVTIGSHTVWVPHDSDGTKQTTISGDYNANISWGGRYYSTMRTSAQVTLPRIARQTTITSFSFPEQLNGGASYVSLNLNQQLSGAVHTIVLRVGNTEIVRLSNSAAVSRINLSASQVQDILHLVTGGRTGTATLEVRTYPYAGGTRIGGVQTATTRFTINLNHNNLKPSISNLTHSPVKTVGDGYEQVERYYQGETRVKASFNSSTKYGASTQTQRMTIRPNRGGGSHTINGSSGTTLNPLNQAGTYTLEAYVSDSRGAVNTATATITVEEYSGITITSFEGTRNSLNPMTIEVEAKVDNTFSSFTYDFYYRQTTGDGATNTLTHIIGGSGSGDTISTQITGTSVTNSYEFVIVVTDGISDNSSSIVVSTERALLSLNEDKGIGIGKIHERGALDASGDIFLSGNVSIIPEETDVGAAEYIVRALTNSPEDTGEISLSQMDGTPLFRLGNYFTDGASGYTAFNRDLRIETVGGELMLTSGGKIYISEGGDSFGYPITDGGETSNGGYIFFHSGIAICWKHDFNVRARDGAGRRYLYDDWVMPISFINSEYTSLAQHHDPVSEYKNSDIRAVQRSGSICRFFVELQPGMTTGNGWNTDLNVFAIGKWR